MNVRLPARLTVVLAAAALLAACAHAPPRNPIAQWVSSPNFDARRPMLIVIHATEEPSAEHALNTLRTANSGGPVSAHYLVGRDGAIYQLVAERDRAWQAGAGRWGTITELNSASIGIELDNDGETPFAQAEIDALIRLLDDLCTRLDIPRDAIIAHADLAPARKRDPGFRFPWKQLADAGFGKWPQGPLVDPPAGFDPWMALRVLGYPLQIDKTPGYTDTVRAFHRHFRGDEYDVLDAEDARILYDLTRLPSPMPAAAPADAAPQAAAPRALEAAGFRYLVFETGAAAPDTTLPMIVGLHYSGATPAAMVDYFDRFDAPVRVVLPQGPQPRPAGFSWFAAGSGVTEQAMAALALADGLAAFVRDAEAAHPTRGKPLAMGVSYGGDLALLLALRHPSLVAAAFPVAARAFPQWLSAAVPCAPECPAVRALHGDADATVPPDAMEAAIPRLKAAGYDATIRTYPGVAHDFDAAMEADFAVEAGALLR
jgi:N-acetylmuramoyl-L-alanine amidase